MRTLITAGALGLALAAGGCSKAEQQNAQATTQAAAQDAKASGRQAGDQVKADAARLGQDLKQSAHKSGDDLKAISKDPEVKKAANDLKASLKEFGASVKDASKKHHDAGNTTETDKSGQ
jgi:hypothetical protein